MKRFIEFLTEKEETFDEFIVKWFVDNKIIDIDDFKTRNEKDHWIVDLNEKNCKAFMKDTVNGKRIKNINAAPYKFDNIKKKSDGCELHFVENRPNKKD
jgi:hypothetical protein